jgi:hypothetical protein
VGENNVPVARPQKKKSYLKGLTFASSKILKERAGYVFMYESTQKKEVVYLWGL